MKPERDTTKVERDAMKVEHDAMKVELDTMRNDRDRISNQRDSYDALNRFWVTFHKYKKSILESIDCEVCNDWSRYKNWDWWSNYRAEW